MTTARSRSRFSSQRTRFVPRPASSNSAGLILLARTVAGGGLIAVIAAASRLMYSLTWQADSAIAVIVATAWILCIELLAGGL